MFSSRGEAFDETWVLEAFPPDGHGVWVCRGSGGNSAEGGAVIAETSGMGKLGGESVLYGRSRGEPSMGRDACEVPVKSVKLE